MKIDLTPLVRKGFLKRAARTDSWSETGMDVQLSTLRNLLKMAHHTEIGYMHDFEVMADSKDLYGRFSTVIAPVEYEDIRQLVMRMVHGEKDVLWRGVCRNFAQSSGTSGGKSKYIPVTNDSLRLNHYPGASDAVAHYLRSNPRSRLFSGRSMILGGSFSNEIQIHSANVKVGDLSATLIDRVPKLVEIIRIPSKKIALMANWEEKLPLLVRSAVDKDVTNISGVPSWFLVVLKKMLEAKGVESIAEIWPNLEVFFHGGISFKPYHDEYVGIMKGLDMHYMENYNASEGFFATQSDPDDHSMLLILDAGVFYEFIDIENESIHPFWEVEKGKVYELVITAPNGLWRYRIGDTVRIDSIRPLKISIAGRTKSYINAFGEELMEYNADDAITKICTETGGRISNYTVAPVYAEGKKKGFHQWIIEWEKYPDNIDDFADRLDKELQHLNSDYEAKRKGDIFLGRLEIVSAKSGLFNKWLKQSGNGKLGGQRKVPRLSNERNIADQLLRLNDIDN